MMFEINQKFTEAEIAMIMRALDFFMYEAPHMTEEMFEASQNALNKVAEAVE